ncbi:hypothetical protein TRICI_005528 [Trichomonascus ciferrii]|uniref:NADH:ubiquinone oxidoreductase intermediate-associated protein 30 domain-containing protein n=1 Tax=Trichomonascus ciferrii TaxID=44093 RepID=A0A642UYM1_9ASCO|nr:hypothetical protein TRICI_005528 [Trichomonascus ciferrii]
MSFLKFLQRSGLVASLPPTEQMVVNFRQMHSPMEALLVRSDQELGGYSTAHLDLISSHSNKPSEGDKAAVAVQADGTPEQFGRFHGNLNLDLPPSRPDVVQSGYAMFRTRDMKPTWRNPLQSEFWNWERCDKLMLRVRGDRRKYFVNIQAESPLITDLYQHRLFLKTPGQWETVLIPLSDFILTNWGVIQHQQEMDLQHIRTIGIGLIDKQYGPFSLDIDWIKVISSDLISKEMLNDQNSPPANQTPGKRLSIDD